MALSRWAATQHSSTERQHYLWWKAAPGFLVALLFSQPPSLLWLSTLQCPLKVESQPSLQSLAAASHMLVMITGDAPLTAVHAASQVHIVTRPVLVMQHK